MSINSYQEALYSIQEEALQRKCMVVENCFITVDKVLDEHFSIVSKDIEEYIFNLDFTCPLSMKELQDSLKELLAIDTLTKKLNERVMVLTRMVNIQLYICENLYHIEKYNVSIQQLIYLLNLYSNSYKISLACDKVISEALSIGLKGLKTPGFIKEILKYTGSEKKFRQLLFLDLNEYMQQRRHIIYNRILNILQSLKFNIYNNVTYFTACKVYGVSS